MAGLSFSQQVEKEMLSMGAKASTAITASVRGMWRVAVEATPRDTGTARSGWKMSTSRRSSYIPKYGPKPAAKLPWFIFRVRKHKKFYFWNNVKYISYLEEGLGPGARVPHYMMRKAIAYFEKECNRRLRAIK